MFLQHTPHIHDQCVRDYGQLTDILDICITGTRSSHPRAWYLQNEICFMSLEMCSTEPKELYKHACWLEGNDCEWSFMNLWYSIREHELVVCSLIWYTDFGESYSVIKKCPEYI